MCGIAGIYEASAGGRPLWAGWGDAAGYAGSSAGGELAGETVTGMVAALRHRGPDGHGCLSSPHAVIGHTRLAIVDLAGGHQPMSAGELHLTFNGEIYNHRELRQRLLGDVALQTSADTEVLLHLYRRFGPTCVEFLDGMFAFAVVDGAHLFLARDPLGIKPLYVGRRGALLSFASELKALAPVADEIREFPAGHWYHSAHGLYPFFTIEQSVALLDPVPEEEGARRDAIEQTLRAAVHKRLMADVPLGVSLSGGLDSSIVALLAAEEIEGLNTFAVGVAESTDRPAAAAMARHLGTRHHERVYTAEEMVAVLPQVLYYLESFDPALVRSAIPNYFLAELCAEHVKVFLTGEGADELYAGYDYLQAYQEPAALQAELTAITYALHNTNLQRADRMSMAFGLEARVPFLDVKSLALAFAVEAEAKLHRGDRAPKALLRGAFQAKLPAAIANRPKEKFSKGAGSFAILAARAEAEVSDADFAAERSRLAQTWNYPLANKEALYYYRILREHYADHHIFATMGRSRSL